VSGPTEEALDREPAAGTRFLVRPGVRRGVTVTLVVLSLLGLALAVLALLRSGGVGGGASTGVERGVLLFMLGVLTGGIGILIASRLVESRAGLERRERYLAGARQRQEVRRAAEPGPEAPLARDGAGTRRVETILMIDLIQSTELINRHGDVFFRDLLRRIESTCIPVARQCGAVHVDGQGDGLLFCFTEPAAALAAFRGIHGRMVGISRGLPGDVKVAFRGSLHVGETVVDARGNRTGLAVIKAVRLGSAMEQLKGRGAGRNSLVVSEEARAPLVAAGAVITPLGEVVLRGFPGTHAVHEVEV
jgi:class 3 adenylate cyclase